VGKGIKLQEAVTSFLAENVNPPLHAHVSKVNAGRLVVPARYVEAWVMVHRAD